MISNEKNKLVLFTLITFFSSWLIWFISGVLLRKGYFIYDSKWLFAQTGAFAPSIVAIFFMNFEKKIPKKKYYYYSILSISLCGWFHSNRKQSNINKGFQHICFSSVYFTNIYYNIYYF
jgi:hypothetical protein